MRDVDDGFVVANLKTVWVRPWARAIALIVNATIIVYDPANCFTYEPPRVAHVETSPVGIAAVPDTHSKNGTSVPQMHSALLARLL